MDRFGAAPIFGRKPHDDREMAVGARLIDVAGAVATDRHANGGVDVARRQPVARGAGAVDVDLNGRLAERGEHRQIGDAAHRAQHRFDLVGGLGERHQIVAIELDRVLALHAGHRLGDVVLQILREAELDAGEPFLQAGQDFRGQLVLVLGVLPLADRLERRKEFRVEQPGGIGAVIGTAMLRHHRLHFVEVADQLAHLVDVAIAFLQRDGRRQRGANPQIAFFQLGQEFQPEQPHQHHGQKPKADRSAQHDLAMAERPMQRRRVDLVQPAHHQRFGFLDMGRQDDGAQRRRHRKRGEQAASQRIGIGARHRPKNVALDAGQREQRQKRRDDDRRRKEDRARHVAGGAENGVALHRDRGF